MRTIKALIAILLLAGLITWANSRESESSSQQILPKSSADDLREKTKPLWIDSRASERVGQRTPVLATEATELREPNTTPGIASTELRSILVQVVDDLNAPIPGAQVWIEERGFESQETSDQMGECTVFFPADSANPVLRAESEGHLTEWQSIRAGQGEARLRLPRMREVFGYVVRSQDGLPVADASVLPVFYGGSPDDSALASISTDASGRFGPLSVPTERMFILRVERVGFRSVGKRVTVKDPDSGNLPPIELELSRQISFRVFEAESGRAIEGAELVAMGGMSESAHTDARGIGLFERLIADSDVERGVRISADGRCNVVARLTQELVAEGAEIQVPLFAECFVSGRTLNSAGTAVGGVRLRSTFDLGEGVRLQRNPDFPNKQLVPAWPAYLEWDPGDWVLEATSDDAGNYSIGNLAPGLVGVNVFTAASQESNPGGFVVPGPRVPGASTWLDVFIE